MKLKNKITQFLETEKASLLSVGVTALLIGIFLTLTFREVRYNSYFPPKIVDIESSEVYKNISSDKDKYIFIDVRSEQEFALAHASGSINLPIHYLYDDTHGKVNAKGIDLPMDKNKEIYITCTGGRLAGVAYGYLEHYGYTNIKRVTNGLAGWRMSGLPVITNQTNLNSANQAPLDLPFKTDND